MDGLPSSTGRPKRKASMRDYSLLYKRPPKVQKTKASSHVPMAETFTEDVADSEITVKNEPILEGYETDAETGMDAEVKPELQTGPSGAPPPPEAIVKDELIIEDVLEPLEEGEEVEMKEEEKSQAGDQPAQDELVEAATKLRIKKKVLRKKVFTERLKVKRNVRLGSSEVRQPKPDKIVKKSKQPKLAKYRPKLFVCGVCSQTFTQNLYFLQHARHMHKPNFDPIEKKPERRYPCELCGMKFGSKLNLVRHKKFHEKRQHAALTVAEPPQDVTPDEDGLIQCSECSRKLSSGEDYVAHYKRHMYLKQLNLACKFCGELFEYKTNLQAHVRTHRGEQDVLGQQDVKDENGMFKCSECTSTFVNRYLCVKHIRTHVSNFRCATCGKFWASEEKLRKHETVHARTLANSIVVETDENGMFKCSEWPKVYTLRMLCSMHMRVVHGKMSTKSQTEQTNPPDGATNCPECSKSFTNPSALYQHLRRHRDLREGRFQCKDCGKNMPSKIALKTHTLIHEHQRKNTDGTNADNFSCSECDKDFPCWKTFARHVMKHKNDKKSFIFTCKICEMVQSLVKHRLISHPGESFDESTIATQYSPLENAAESGELKCPECGKTCTNRANLSLHITKHNNLRIGRFTCKYCQRKHGTRAELTRHELRHEKSRTMKK